jgi:hypothetical protein
VTAWAEVAVERFEHPTIEVEIFQIVIHKT